MESEQQEPGSQEAECSHFIYALEKDEREQDVGQGYKTSRPMYFLQQDYTSKKFQYLRK